MHFLIRYIFLCISLDSPFHTYLLCGDRMTFYRNLEDFNPLFNTGVMAPATNLTALAAWTAHTSAGTHVQHYNLTAPQHWQPGPHMPPQHSHSKYINYTKYIMYVVGNEYM